MGGPRCPGDPHPWTPASRASPPSRDPGIHRPPPPRGPGVQGITPTHGPPCLGSTPSNPHSPPRPRYLGAPPPPEPGTPPRTLAVAQQVDAISGVGHDGGQRAAEPLHLHPQRPQRCPPVEEVQDRHLRPWVALGGRRQGCGCQRGGSRGGQASGRGTQVSVGDPSVPGVMWGDPGVCGGPRHPGGLIRGDSGIRGGWGGGPRIRAGSGVWTGSQGAPRWEEGGCPGGCRRGPGRSGRAKGETQAFAWGRAGGGGGRHGAPGMRVG